MANGTEQKAGKRVKIGICTAVFTTKTTIIAEIRLMNKSHGVTYQSLNTKELISKQSFNFKKFLPKKQVLFGCKKNERMVFEKSDQNATCRYALNVPVQNLVWESVVIQEKQIFDVNVFVNMKQFCMLESVFLKIQIKFKIRMNASQKMTAEPELAVIKQVINIFIETYSWEGV